MYVQSLLPLPIGSRVLFELELSEQTIVKVHGEVRHSLENSYGSLPAGFGVQFLDLSETDREKIIHFVNTEES